MVTTAHSPEPASSSLHDAGEYRNDLPLKSIHESFTNPRRIFHALDDLAASIKRHGVLSPLLVRPIETDGFEIVFGARRFRAARLAGLDVIPARVKDMSDEEVLEIQLIENLQREDVHPLEEADGYARLLQVDGYTADLIAEKVGKDRSYIYKRLQLAQLIERVKEAFFAEKIQLAHALRICRLPKESDQIAAFESCFPSAWKGNKRLPDFSQPADSTAARLDEFIRQEITLDLSAAPWKKDDADLLPAAGPCKNCSKRTAANAQLFDDIVSSKKGTDLCLDRSCYLAKREAFVKIRIAKAEEAGETLVRLSTTHDTPHGVLREWSDYKKIEAPAARCKDTEKGIITHGARIGTEMEICRTKSCGKHFANLGRSQKPLTIKEQWAEKRKRLQERIQAESHRELIRRILSKGMTAELGPAHRRIIADRLISEYLRHDGQREFCAAIGVEVTKGKFGTNYKGAIQDTIKADDGLGGLIMALCASSPYGNDAARAIAVAKLYKLDPEAIAKKIAAPILEKFEAAKKKAMAAAKSPASTKAAAAAANRKG